MRRAWTLWSIAACVAVLSSGCLRNSFDLCENDPPHPECLPIDAGRDARADAATLDAAANDDAATLDDAATDDAAMAVDAAMPDDAATDDAAMPADAGMPADAATPVDAAVPVDAAFDAAI